MKMAKQRFEPPPPELLCSRPPEEVAAVFFNEAPAQLADLWELFRVLNQTKDEVAQQEKMVDLYLQTHS